MWATASADKSGMTETLSIALSGVPDGASFTALVGGIRETVGSDDGGGVWSFGADEFEGLSITPPADYAGNFELTLDATSTETNGDAATTSSSFSVMVSPTPDAAIPSTVLPQRWPRFTMHRGTWTQSVPTLSNSRATWAPISTRM